jgi:hypothetical protein
LEADLQRYYQVELGALYRGELTLRRLCSLIAYLPPGSATWAAQGGLPYGWSLTDLLLADLFHATTGEKHPARPSGNEKATKERAEKVAAALLAQRKRLGQES